ncbi:D-alanyl-D-alanine dipeptidase [Micromonospora luteifusca]|uniref:D-alanyl-D-alanine dipeptidase n=1 Tax=Micromonospora luteifusca TaxID=709860 RepID=A0ABS2M2L2_9ACTN|nr:M15 family metallopeptidase [Micromonospora luteifusca]MBM7494684.1 D-alanyl-D-alanine dipeptidase [Micromonospora luteifusca]
MRYRLAVVLALAALLGGCSRPEPRPAPQPTPVSPTPRPTPVPSPTSASPVPAADRLPGFVVLTDVDPRIHADIRYATAHNFVGRPITAYREPLCLLTRQAAEALRRVQDAALAGGHSLKVYDCYRPQPAVDDFVAWSKRPGEQQTKAEFYPDVAKNRLFAEGYIGAPTAHSRGSTMDLTLVDEPAASQSPYRVGQPLVACTAPRGQRFADNSIDMGTGFDCFDARAHTADPRITGTVRDNRRLLQRLMTDAGFVNYAREWWHYSLRDEPYPDTFFTAPVARSSVG